MPTSTTDEKNLPRDSHEFQINEVCYCKYMTRGLERWYEAKILKIKKDKKKDEVKYFVHYQGWNKRFDFWAREDSLVKDSERTRKIAEDLEQGIYDNRMKGRTIDEVLEAGSEDEEEAKAEFERKKEEEQKAKEERELEKKRKKAEKEALLKAEKQQIKQEEQRKRSLTPVKQEAAQHHKKQAKISPLPPISARSKTRDILPTKTLVEEFDMGESDSISFFQHSEKTKPKNYRPGFSQVQKQFLFNHPDFKDHLILHPSTRTDCADVVLLPKNVDSETGKHIAIPVDKFVLTQIGYYQAQFNNNHNWREAKRSDGVKFVKINIDTGFEVDAQVIFRYIKSLYDQETRTLFTQDNCLSVYELANFWCDDYVKKEAVEYIKANIDKNIFKKIINSPRLLCLEPLQDIVNESTDLLCSKALLDPESSFKASNFR